MAIGGFFKSRNVPSRNRFVKRATVRRVLLEALEPRQLLTVGPQLVGIQPNAGSLLEGGEVLQVSPTELIFRFDDSAGLDPNTLSGIRIVQSGADGLFERASVATDFGTNGQTLVEFYAREVGEAGNGLTIQFSRVSRTDSRQPKVSVSGRTIQVELNSNPLMQTRVQDLLQVFSVDGQSAASHLVYALRLRGSDTIGIGLSTDIGRSYVLTGASAAKAATDFGLGNTVLVQFIAREPGDAGTGIRVQVTSSDRGGAASPIVSVSGKTINIDVNRNSQFPTTLQEFVDALSIPGSPAASLIETRLVSGSGVIRMGTQPTTYSPIILGGISEVEIVPGYIGFGDTDREVVLRFAERLPQNQYRIDILGQGSRALRNINGQVFNEGVSRSVVFGLNLGARVESVVPQPVFRNANGSLSQQRNQIDLYFNEDKLVDLGAIASINGIALPTVQQSRSPFYLQNTDVIVLKTGGVFQPTVLQADFYQLFHTAETLDSRDDIRFLPSAIRYYPEANRVTLTFAQNLDQLRHPTTNAILPAADLRLRVGTNEAAPLPPTHVDALAQEPGDSFATAMNLNGSWAPGTAGSQSVLIDAQILNTSPFLLDFPGGSDEPGNRINRYQDNLRLLADEVDGASVIYYNFQNNLGRLFSSSSQLLNAITEQQRLRVREVLSLYEQYLGVRFVETASTGLTIAVGDMRAIVPFEDVVGGGNPGVGAINSPASHYYKAGYLINGQLGTVLDIQDFSVATLNEFGGPFQRAAMQAIGRLLGLGLADEVQGFTIMAYNSPIIPGVGTDIVLPGDVDIVHGQYLYRPDSKDIDLYQFTLPTAGRITIETFAERMAEVSLLDTSIRLYQQDEQGGWIEIAANDDYFSLDSFIQLDLAQGNYIVGVSASGNRTYDPTIEDSGLGGRSDGRYQLRMDFQPPAQGVLNDSTGVALDGNSNGESGGVFNFWFRPSGPSNTKFVDKIAPAGGNGSLATPYRNIQNALAAAQPGDVVRIVGNGGADGLMSTLTDNLAYEIGFNNLGQPLPDGTTFDVPRGVSVMIDAGAVLKMRRSRIGVGSTTPSVDRSGGSLLVLGTPTLVSVSGEVLRDASGQPLAGSVYFTSVGDVTVGKNANLAVVGTTPTAGDWGGIDFRNRVDHADPNRINNELQGQFLNWIAHADIRYGGGQVVIDGVSQVVTPVQMVDARPTVGNSLITRSADAAMSATPNSFLESNFHSPAEQAAAGAAFSVDYDRVGPAIYYNRLLDNSINGLQVRMRTLPVSQLEIMTVPGRFDDTDIVHYLPENLVIAGTPGGARLINESVSTTLVTLQPQQLGTLTPGLYNYRFTRVVNGVESVASEPTRTQGVSGGAIVLGNIPVGVNRVYRSGPNGAGPYVLVGQLNGNTASFTDSGTNLGVVLDESDAQFSARLDARLAIDPGTIVKSQGSRIEVRMGGQLIAEGVDGRPVVFTAVADVRYGAGGTFRTSNHSHSVSQGDWGGIFVGHTSKASLDHVVITYGGGSTRVDGGFSDFNAVEVHQGQLRLTNSRLELNADGAEVTNDPLRAGHGWNSPATIFVRGAQPIIAGNIIQHNAGPAISANVNALNYQLVTDWGRSRGELDRVIKVGNRGPLVIDNRLANNPLNGMVIRGGVMTTEGVWDDTDIVHVVQDEIIVSDHNHFGGLRLTSRLGESLVVKMDGPTAGFTATGIPLDNANRIGGSLQIAGLPGFPVIITSIFDDTVGAGFQPDGRPQTDTNNDGDFRRQIPEGPIGTRVVVSEVTTDANRLRDALLGPGIRAVGDARFVGSAVSAGFFSGGGSSIGIESGIILSTGDARSAEGPNTSPGTSGQASGAGDADLDTLFGFPGPNDERTLDTTSLEFEFESTGGDLFFNFVFASEEYNEFVNSPFNDVFAFFVNGINIALIPGTNTPVSINTVNGGNPLGVNATNPQYFINNELGTGQFLNEVEYDGFTQVFTAVARDLGPGVHTIKLAISDVSDTILDSAVFLQLGSFSDEPVGVPPKSGDWRSIRLQTHSNDRNVGVVVENESPTLVVGSNNTPLTAQYLGGLAANEKSGDENQRLGFHILGHIANPTDIDVYSFTGVAGTEVWLDIDGTDNSLDTVIELIDASGRILALSSNSLAEEADPSLLYRAADMAPLSVHPLRKAPLEFTWTSAQGVAKDLNSTNPRDAGMRVFLPGEPGSSNLYHVRVRSSSLKTGDPVSDLLLPGSLTGGLTQGSYILQIRLDEVDEVPGSGINYADIRYATNGIELIGVPSNSPLLGENVSVELNPDGQPNNLFENAQPLGNLLQTNRQAISVAGVMNSNTDVDWFSFDILYDRITLNDVQKYFATVFDVDYADGIGRPDISLYVFDANGNLIMAGLGSALVDDQPTPLAGGSNADLDRGSFGAKDAFIGVAELRAGRYFLAVTNDNMAPAILDAYTNPESLFTDVRMEPISTVVRVAQDHVGTQGYNSGSTAVAPLNPLFSINNIANLEMNAIPFHLQDVALYVSRAGTGGLKLINPFTGQEITTLGSLPAVNTAVGDLAMRSDGRLFMVEGIFGPDAGATDNTAGRLVEIDPNTVALEEVGNDQIPNFDPDLDPPDTQQLTSNNVSAMAYRRLGFNIAEDRVEYELYYAVDGAQIGLGSNISTLYAVDPDSGSAQFDENDPFGPGVRGAIYFQVPGDIGRTTGMAFLGNQLYGVSDQGWFFQIQAYNNPFNPNSGRALNPVFVGANFNFSGLTLGPQNAENGRLSQMFFAITSNGRLTALNAQGQLQPVFANGATFVNMQVGSIAGPEPFSFATGLGFSPVDFNLWHPTNTRGTDAGHGIIPSPDGTRTGVQGGLSFHFGLEQWVPRGQAPYTIYTSPALDPLGTQPGMASGILHRDLTSNPNIGNNYNLPGGAAGVLETHSFSLKGISPDDLPTLYFNYFAETDGINDRLRVYGTGADGQWILLASNFSTPNGFTPGTTQNPTTQRLFNNTEVWRQARVPLDLLAGQESVKLRFEFATGGSMGYGLFGGRGPEIRTLPGNQLFDGQVVTVGGVNFELEMGLSLNLPSGGALQNGNGVVVNGLQYIFYDGAVPPPAPAIGVPFDATLSAAQVAEALAQAILANSPGVVPQVFQNRVQLVGAATANVVSGPINVGGAVGSTGVPVFVTLDMSASQVAQALQASLANHFAGGILTAFPIRGGDLISLTSQPSSAGFNPGPFGGSASFVADNIGNSFKSLQRAQENDFEGIYLDDFIIGIAGRGELVLGTSTGEASGVTDFIVDPQQTVSSPARIRPSVLQGPYQLEIRGGASMGTPQPIGSSVGLELNVDRILNPIDQLLSPVDRLSQGFSIRFNSPANLIAGDTFTISDGVRVLTFELDDVNDGVDVQPGHIALPFNTAVWDPLNQVHRPETAEQLAARFRDLINSSVIQSLLKGVSANLINNDRAGTTNDTVVINGSSEIFVPDTVGQRIDHQHRGGANRERPQGQVVINATRVSHSQEFGAVVLTAPRDPLTGAPIAGAPRNTVTLNEQRLAPGAAIVNSEFLFNSSGGISIQGDAGGAGLPPATVPFVRLVNNTIVGGTISATPDLAPAIYGGYLFRAGDLSFADRVVSFTPGNPAAVAGLSNPADALGPPRYSGSGEPQPGEGVVSLGRGGRLVVQFTNNYLTGSDSPAPDLVIFEVGDAEQVQVEVSQDGVSWVSVGTASASSPAIDLDAYGFNSSSRLSFVRLTDVIAQGSQSGSSVGADIDAIGALSTVPVDRYTAGGVGISVTQNATATLLNNVLVNNTVGITVDASSSSTVVGGSVYQLNTANVAGAVTLGQFPLVVANNVALFVSPGTGNFQPARRSPLIDSAIDSVPDRAALVAVKQPLGYAASPILAPRFDLNGQLRVDDPTVGAPSGSGETAFKDRGAQERGDFAGPTVILGTPVDNDSAGLDLNPELSVVELIGITPQYFELLLLDGLEPSNPTSSSGIDHATVNSSTVLVYRNNVPLVEGLDYRFGYNSTNGVVRLQPLAGIWRGQSVYTIQLINANQPVIVARVATAYSDGDQFEIMDAAGSVARFEFDLGFLVRVPNNGIDSNLVDGGTFVVDDGAQRITFEFDTNGTVTNGNLAISLSGSNLLGNVTQAIVDAIAQTSLQVDARMIRPGEIQVLGSSEIQISPLTSGLTISGQTGVQGEFGLQIPLAAGVPVGLTDGQSFTINRSSGPVRFELDNNGSVQNGSRPVVIPPNATAAQVGAALVAAINSAGMGLTPVYVGQGVVRLGGDANTRLDMTNTVLSQVGAPGEPAAIPIVLPADATAEQVAVIIEQAIQSTGLTGVTISSFGHRLVVHGAQAVSGTGAVQVGAIRDMAGNPLRPNQADGTTTLTVFLGEGLDYGDAPPPYQSLHADNGPRHRVVDGLSLGPTVTADADARLPNADLDDGVTFTALYAAFQANAQINVTNTTGQQAYVSVWVDFNGDGFFANGERVADGISVNPGTTTVSFLVPVNAVPGETYARVRLSTDRESIRSPLGAAPDGEVEDWAIPINTNPFTNANWNLDVNASGNVSSIDALQVINWLNDPTKPRDLTLSGATFAPPYVDVNGDGRVTALDALLVINYLNTRPPVGGEGEMALPAENTAGAPLADPLATQLVSTGDWVANLFGGADSSPSDARATSGLTSHDQVFSSDTGASAHGAVVTAVGQDHYRGDWAANAVDQALSGELMEDLLEELLN